MNAKHALKAGAGWLYLHSPASRRQRHGAGMILMLHRVIADDRAAALPHRNELCIGVRAFEQLLRWLGRHFDCVPLMELLEPSLPASARLRVALTFDDGWRDNAIHAFPLLQRYAMPASIFLSSDFIGSRRAFWWEALGKTLWGSHGEAARQRLYARLPSGGQTLSAERLQAPDEEQRSLALAHYLQSLKHLPASELQALADSCPSAAEPQALDWQQVRTLEDSGLVRFGPHGGSHAILTALDDIQLERELHDSSAALRQQCRVPLPVYCYPNGDHDARVRQRVAAHHYDYALGTKAGLYQVDGEPLAIPRIGVSQHTAQRPALLAWRMLRSMQR